MRRILIPLDDSHATSKVIDAAVDMASALGSRLCLLHIADIDSISIGYDLESAIGREETAKVLHREHQWLLTLEKDLKERGLDVTAILRRGEIVPEILREAQRFQPYLIVMGSHGHTGLHHLLLGSVSTGVLHGASCPVLIIPTRNAATAG
jgi:nucleotide-binding universal stress UspA family protein